MEWAFSIRRINKQSIKNFPKTINIGDGACIGLVQNEGKEIKVGDYIFTLED